MNVRKLIKNSNFVGKQVSIKYRDTRFPEVGVLKSIDERKKIVEIDSILFGNKSVPFSFIKDISEYKTS